MHGSQSVRHGMLSVNWPELRMPRPELELVIVSGGDQNHSNVQGQATQCQPTQRGTGENNQDQNGHENVTPQNWPQTKYCQQHEGSPPMYCKCGAYVSHNCPST